MHENVFRFGADYYPEQWPEERWPEDARLMAEAGFNVVRLAEFAWSKLEPEQGEFDFEWLDRVLDILRARGISAVLGTPTASPPPWLMKQEAEVFRVRDDGRRVTFGNRCEFCPTHPAYREHARRIVTAMAGHYAAHPAAIGWQIDNELGGRCYCPVCQANFQGWLRKRYGSLAKLNACWGTAFWSHTYADWTEIPVPLTTGGSPNPGLALDFDRFLSDAFVSYQQLQVDILRQSCPHHFITHNFMGFGYEGLNYYDLAHSLDFVAWDNYPSGFWSQEAVDPVDAALSADTMRGLKRQNCWVMEQQAGPSGWETLSPTPRPGELRLWAYQSIAHGADAVVFFRWRTARHGTEQYWHGLLDHDGRPTRRYEEIKRLGAELHCMGDLIRGSAVRSPVAILNSYDSRWGFQIQANSAQFRYGKHVRDVYSALFQRHIPVDILSPAADLSHHRLVIVPAMYVLGVDAAASIERFVAGGGTLIVTPRSGVKDEANAVVDQPLPGLLAEVCGATVEEYDALRENGSQGIKFTVQALEEMEPLPARIWCDILLPKTAEVIARYTEDPYAGRPAICLNRFGEGQAIYVGTFGTAALYQALFGWLLPKLDLHESLTVPPGFEIGERWQGNRQLLFILNHTNSIQALSIPDGYEILLAKESVSGKTTLAAHEVLVLASRD